MNFSSANSKGFAGRDPALVLFTQRERIMETDELAAALARHRIDRERMIEESRAFWQAESRRDNRPKAAPVRRDVPQPVPAVPDSHLEAFRGWRRGGPFPLDTTPPSTEGR